MQIKTTLMKLILSATVIVAGNAFALPAAFDATYSVKTGSMSVGLMNSSLRYNGNRYHYHKKSQATGLASFLSGDTIIENADGTFQGEFLQSGHYLYQHKNRRKERTDRLSFKTPTSVAGSYKNRRYQLQVPAKTIDRASMELALARDVAKNARQLNYHVVERGKQKNYALKYIGDETLKLGSQAWTCKKFVVQRQDGNRKTLFWLAREADFLPVKIVHDEKGDTITTTLKSYKPLNQVSHKAP